MTLLERALGFFIDAKPVVGLLLVLLLVMGVRAAPFASFDALPIERDPVPVDAIPDLGDNQQIVVAEWPGRSPRDVEDQVTYPLTTALLGVPGVRTVRSTSALGFSMTYVIFDDDVELYWSRTRVLERLASLPAGALPPDVRPTLGPDATALGQIFWYTLEGRDAEGHVVGGWDRHELRTLQDFVVRPALAAVDGVAEVSSIGGAAREYQVEVDPDALRDRGVSLLEVAAAVRGSNLDVGARTLEVNRVEYLVRGLGSVEGVADLEQAVVAYRDDLPIRVSDVAHVQIGPGPARGGLDDAGADVVGGVVVARVGANPRAVIAAVREAIEQLAPALPRRDLEGGGQSHVTLAPFYDRAELIDETVQTLESALLQQVLITLFVVLVFLREVESSLVVASLVPLGVLLALAVMKAVGVDANLMALGGIAIAIGTMVDLSIVFTERISASLDEARDEAPDELDRAAIVKQAAADVAPSAITSTLTTALSFLPLLGLQSSEARLFGPLVLTKTFAMGAALLLGLVVVPTLAQLFVRPRVRSRTLFGALSLGDGALLGIALALFAYSPAYAAAALVVAALGLAKRLVPERLERPTKLAQLAVAALIAAAALADVWRPVDGALGGVGDLLFVGVALLSVLGLFALFAWVYPTLLRAFLEHKLAFLSVPVVLVALGLSAWLGLDAAWVPEPLRRAFPGLEREYLPDFDEGAFLYMPSTMPHASVGEVRAQLSAMDAAIATIPEVERVVGKWGRVDSALDPAPASMIETIVTYRPEYSLRPDGTRHRNWRPHIRSPSDIWAEITRLAERPGFTSAPVLMPIGARLVMLQSGMRAPLGLQLRGPDLEGLASYGRRLEAALREVPELRAQTVLAERVVGKPYLELDVDRAALARHGLSLEAVQRTLSMALGGAAVGEAIDGRERLTLRVRYAREERDLESIGRVLVSRPGGPPVPLSSVVELRYARGPQGIRAEDSFPTAYVTFDRQPDVSEVAAMEAALARVASMGDDRPEGVTVAPAGRYLDQLRSEASLRLLIPVALLCVLAILFLQFRRTVPTLTVFGGVLVAASGGFLLVWAFGQPGFLAWAPFGLSLRELLHVETLHLSVAVWVGMIALVGIATDDGVLIASDLTRRFREPLADVAAIRAATLAAGERRLRPCLMTTATTLLALLPVLTSNGRGAEIMRALAVPIVGGMSVELVTLFVVPVLLCAHQEALLRWTTRTESDSPLTIHGETP